MKNLTAAQKEKHLNAIYADSYSQSEALDNFIYLTNKARAKRTTEANIIKHFVNHELGTLLRKYDPIAFNCA